MNICNQFYGGIKMIEYLKMVIVAIVTGFIAPLPVSSAAHYNFFANVIGLTAESERLTLYYSIFMLCFSLVIFLVFRKTVLRGFKLAFKKNSDNSRDNRYFIKTSSLATMNVTWDL